jgi:hypothetical protein
MRLEKEEIVIKTLWCTSLVLQQKILNTGVFSGVTSIYSLLEFEREFRICYLFLDSK